MNVEDRAIRSVLVTTELQVSLLALDDITRRLNVIHPRWPQRPLDLLGGEASDNELLVHHLEVEYPVRANETDCIGVEIAWSRHELARRVPARRRRHLAERSEQIADVLAALQPHAGESRFHCSAHWVFAMEAVIPIVQLPLLRIRIPGTPYEQISGVRFAAPSKDPMEHVILDLGDQDQLNVSIGFTYFDTLSHRVIENAVERGANLKEAFVKQREGGA